jgi:heme o synthase
MRRARGPGTDPAAAAPSLRPADFLELTKPRVTSMVLVTTAVGYYLGAGASFDLLRLLNTLLGTALVAAGTSALNQYVEKEADGLMLRTRLRPLPSGRLADGPALAFAVTISVAGLLHLLLTVNALSAGLAAFTLVSYVFLYTPLKKRSSLCTLVGAVPGAIPPLIGWAAARGDLSAGGLALFAILFVWQLPHSLAIAVMYRDDYARGGFALLPVVDPDGGSTERQIVVQSLVLLPVSLVPALIGLAGPIYFYGALILGIGLVGLTLPVVLRRTTRAARRVVLASVVYLPALLGLLAANVVGGPPR